MSQEVKDYLLTHGIKPSIQRMAIMNYLFVHRIHPTADEIYCALNNSIPTLSKTTVYNTLKLFAEQGALMTLVIDEKNIRFDVDTSRHAHFQCLCCGEVYDVPAGQWKELNVKEIGDLTVTEIHLYYKGYCKICQTQLNGKAICH